mgnify:CR=1 FL=1
MRGEKILVTGGAGFIGSNFIERAINEGNEIYCLDCREDLQNINMFDGSIKHIHMDVCDKTSLYHLFQKHHFDGVIHLAAVSRVVWGEHDPDNCLRTNTIGTRNLIEMMEKTGLKVWLIFGSSREVYGEPSSFPVNENAPKNPINIYGRTKLDGERMVKDWSNRSGNPSAVLRFSNVYGNEKDILDRVLPRFVLRAIRNQPLEIHGGNQLIDFTHINDTVEGIFRTIDYLNNGCDLHDEFHLLTGKGTTLQESVKVLSDHTGIDHEFIIKKGREYDVDRFVGDPSKAMRKLNFRAEIRPDVGIPLTCDRFQEVFFT